VAARTVERVRHIICSIASNHLWIDDALDAAAVAERVA
jgi:hypothetical protein